MKADGIEASFSNGRLQLTIPKPEETTPKEVKVHVEHAESNLRIAKKDLNFIISHPPPVGSTSCQSSIMTPFGNDGGQACDFSVSHVTAGSTARVLLVSMSGNVAQREKTDETSLLVEDR